MKWGSMVCLMFSYLFASISYARDAGADLYLLPHPPPVLFAFPCLPRPGCLVPSRFLSWRLLPPPPLPPSLISGLSSRTVLCVVMPLCYHDDGTFLVRADPAFCWGKLCDGGHWVLHTTILRILECTTICRWRRRTSPAPRRPQRR